MGARFAVLAREPGIVYPRGEWPVYPLAFLLATVHAYLNDGLVVRTEARPPDDVREVGGDSEEEWYAVGAGDQAGNGPSDVDGRGGGYHGTTARRSLASPIGTLPRRSRSPTTPLSPANTDDSCEYRPQLSRTTTDAHDDEP